MVRGPDSPGTHHAEALHATASLPKETMTPADYFEHQWRRAIRLIRIALLVLGTILALAGYLILT